MEKGTKRRVKKLGTAFFVLYVLVLVYLLFFSEGYGRVADAEREYRYNLVPFVEIRRFWTYRKIVGTFALFTNVFGNVLGFVPYGFILPVITGKMRNGFFIILSGFFISLTIEVIQLLTKVGCFDVDDMICKKKRSFQGKRDCRTCGGFPRAVYRGSCACTLF